MTRTVWKDGHVISIETRTGVFVLAQMTRSPFLIFFNAFSTNDKWSHIDLAKTPILFCNAVTRQFLNFSNVTKHKEVKPLHVTDLPTRWIHGNVFKPRKLRVWRGKPHEREVFCHEGGSLVEKEVLRHKGKRAHPSGIFDRIIIKSIDPSDSDTIDQHEIDSLAVFPATNERLYLCQKFGRNVDPDKDVMFDRKMPLDYLTYIDIGLAATDKEKNRLLALFKFTRPKK